MTNTRDIIEIIVQQELEIDLNREREADSIMRQWAESLENDMPN